MPAGVDGRLSREGRYAGAGGEGEEDMGMGGMKKHRSNVERETEK